MKYNLFMNDMINFLNPKLILLGCFFVSALCVNATSVMSEYEDETVTGVNREEGRSTFWYYSDRANAINGGYYNCKDNISLNGKWKFHFCEKPVDRIVNFYQTEFDVSDWKEIDVPGSWPLQGYDKPLYMNHPYEFNTINPYPYKVPVDWNPVGAYRRNFTIPSGWSDKRIVLHFGAVKSAFYVFVNGHKVGYSQDSKMQAEFDITAYVKTGTENVLAVEVYRFSKGSYLEGQDFWRLAGIKRDVWLYATPKVFLQDFFAKSTLINDYKDGNLDLSLTLRNLSNKIEVPEITVSLLDLENRIVFEEKKTFQLKKNQTVTQSLNAVIKDCKSWNAENPQLYFLMVAVKTKDGITYSSSKIGFRSIEIKNSFLYINGKYVYMKGVNRHEHHPKYGHYIPKETMEKDVEMIKKFNINAVRTAHYPADPYFYELCNQYGVYIIDEANIESHGLGAALQNVIDSSRHIANDTGWEAIHLDRMKRMFQRDKNHPSVILWSMGNECGDGRNFVAGYNMLHKLDPTRFVQFEQAGNLPHTDIYCPMYMKIDLMKNYALSANVTKPLILCEYAHSMGNSLGNFQDYWDLIETYPVLQGGFIWDFVDQGMENFRGGQRFFDYGGGFGQENFRNDANFCVNGLFNPDREPNPHAYEARKVYQNIRVKENQTGEKNSFVIVNNHSFTNTNYYSMKWSVLKDGNIIESGIKTVDVEPLKSRIITVPYQTSITADAEYLINFEFITRSTEGLLPSHWVVAYDQLPLNKPEIKCIRPDSEGELHVVETSDSVMIKGANGMLVTFSKTSGALSKFVYSGFDYIKSPMLPDFYRIPNDNDQWDAENNVWLNTAEKIKSVLMDIKKDPVEGEKDLFKKVTVSVKYTLISGEMPQQTVWYDNTYTIYPDGKIEIHNRFNPKYYNGEANMSIPRIGQVVQINGELSNARWYGRGPWENYADRKTSALLGIYAKSVKDLAYDYIRPQENGYRTDVRWLELTNKNGYGIKIEGMPGFCFNAQHTAQKNYYHADGKHIRYTVDMKSENDYYLNIDYGQKGVGGDNSWGKPVHNEYLVLLRYYEYGYSLIPKVK